MNIIIPKTGDLDNILLPIDENIITELTKIAFKCNKKTESYNLRNKLYSSKYNVKDLTAKEKNLEFFLQSLNEQKVRTEIQNKEYKWVKINTENMGQISSRFYIAPNPENMHEIVKNLVEVFSSQQIPVRLKYQLSTNMEQCDRIIIYSDFPNKDKIENAIKKVYQEKQSLFDGCERSVAWIYKTSVPNVYNAPETPGVAYSNRLAEAIIEAKITFDYLYGLTNNNNNITLNGKEAEQAMDWMKLLIPSLMLRKGVLLSKDDKCITFKDKNIKTFYDFKTGILTNNNTNEIGYYEVKFSPTPEGKKLLLENFYNVSNIKPQKGLTVRYLTPEEREEDLDRNLNLRRYNSNQQSSSKKH